VTDVIACNAAYNEGGVGQVFAYVVERARKSGDLQAYYTTGAKPNDNAARVVSLTHYRWLFTSTPLRLSHAWRDFVAADLFDRAVARKLEPGDRITAFSGRALRTLRSARRVGYSRLVLEACNSHVAHVRRQHARATTRYGIESSWLNDAQFRKTLREYELADEIVVLSEYARATFLREGIPEAKIRRRYQPVASRFAPPLERGARERFTVAFVGRLHVTKGIVDLLDAFSRVEDDKAELLLVGGCATAAMDRYITQRAAVDGRIRRCPGDPLPVLHRADVLVHPSYEDALALAPLEALACGVPVIVSEDTGMKEFVRQGETGFVVPTGDVYALVTALEAIQKRPLTGALPESCRA
jgi:glycosyltransferase involved in cell wall biosynthesis